MARILIVGCGCRGRLLAQELVAAGHAVRGTTRNPEDLGGIETCGAEAVLADPDRVGTVLAALTGVAVVCWLMGSASGSSDQLNQLHGPRLAAMLERTVDTGVRGFVYEAVGSVSDDLLQEGGRQVEHVGRFSHLPTRFIREDPTDYDRWLKAAFAEVAGLLG